MNKDLIAQSIANGNLTLSDYNKGNYYFLEGEYYNKENYNKERQFILWELEEAGEAGEATEEEFNDFVNLYPYIK